MEVSNPHDFAQNCCGLFPEIWITIFGCLPIHAILQCSLVCKSWYRWAMKNDVWLPHVHRVLNICPQLENYFEQGTSQPVDSSGKQVPLRSAKKKRKVGSNRRSVVPPKKWLAPLGYWRKFRSLMRPDQLPTRPQQCLIMSLIIPKPYIKFELVTQRNYKRNIRTSSPRSVPANL